MESLLGKATPKWCAEKHGWGWTLVGIFLGVTHRPMIATAKFDQVALKETHDRQWADAQLMEALRNNAESMIAEIKRLRSGPSEVKILRDGLEEIFNRAHENRIKHENGDIYSTEGIIARDSLKQADAVKGGSVITHTNSHGLINTEKMKREQDGPSAKRYRFALEQIQNEAGQGAGSKELSGIAHNAIWEADAAKGIE